MKMVSIAPSKLLSTVLVMVMTAYVSTAQPVISKQPLDQAIQPAQNVSFTIQASGPASLSYSWKKDGVTIPDQTSNSITTGTIHWSQSLNSIWFCLFLFYITGHTLKDEVLVSIAAFSSSSLGRLKL